MKIEFYKGNARGHMAVVDADAVPRKGEAINIRGVSWRIGSVTWALDRADHPDATLRACVSLEPM